MSRMAKSARPVSSSFTESVEAEGANDVEPHALGHVVVSGERGVDPGVNRVRGEVEDEGRLARREVGSTRTRAAAAERRGDQRGEQQSGDPSRAHRGRTMASVESAVHGATRHVQPQLHAVAVPDLPVLLQVLRVRDPPAAPLRAG